MRAIGTMVPVGATVRVDVLASAVADMRPMVTRFTVCCAGIWLIYANWPTHTAVVDCVCSSRTMTASIGSTPPTTTIPGASWWERLGHRVGCGGFCLRSCR